MILHATSLAALFMDALQQARVQIQCVSNTGQDPLWARLLFAAIPSIFALGIAWMAVRWNTTKENKQWERNQQAAHEQWVRDQKKADWRELIKAVSQFGAIVPAVSVPEVDYIGIAKQLVGAIQRVEETYSNCLFLDDFFGSQENRDFVLNFQNGATKAADRILSPEHRIKQSRSDQDKLDVINERSGRCSQLRIDYIEFMHWLQGKARKDIGTDVGSPC